MNPAPTKEKEIHWFFVISIILKGLNALIETFVGILFLFTGTASGLIVMFTRGELIEDPKDFVATHIQGLLPYINTHTQLFAAAYLLIHGVVKIILVWALLKNKLWAYPTSIIVLLIFLTYQLVRFTETHSITLALLSIFDVIVLWLIWHEYRYLKTKTV